FVPKRGGSLSGAGKGAGLDRYGGTATASGEDADRGRPAAGWLRLSGLSFRRGNTLAPTQEPGQAEGHAARPNPAHPRAEPVGHHHPPEPDAARRVWIFPAPSRDHLSAARSVGTNALAQHLA